MSVNIPSTRNIPSAAAIADKKLETLRRVLEEREQDKRETENERLRRVIKDGLRFLVIKPRSRGDRVYQALVEAVE